VRVSVKESSPCSAPEAYCTVWNENPARNTRSPSLSFGDYARNNLRATARFGMRMSFQKKARVKPFVLKLTLTLASVRKRRFELPRLLPRYHLKVVRLPISPPPQGVQTYYNLANFSVPRNVFRRRRRRCGFGGLLRNVPHIVFRRRRRLCGIGGNNFNIVFRRRRRLCGIRGNIFNIVFRRRRRLCGIGGNIFNPEKILPKPQGLRKGKPFLK